MKNIVLIIAIIISFIILTLPIVTSGDTIPEVPEEVAQGYAVWQAYGCESCHTLFGQGGIYAPDLTHIYTLRGEDYIRDFMINPSAYHPNERIMPNFNLKETDTTSLISMLAWTANAPEVSANWPPNPIQVRGSGGMMVNQSGVTGDLSEQDPILTRGRTLYSQRCASCHAIAPDVIIVGPSFWNIANTASERVDGSSAEDYIRNSILYPSDYIVDGFADVMQKNLAEVLSSEDIEALIAYLMTFDGQES